MVLHAALGLWNWKPDLSVSAASWGAIVCTLGTTANSCCTLFRNI